MQNGYVTSGRNSPYMDKLHAETSTTMNIYAHSLQKLDEQTSDIFEKLIEKQA